MRCSGPGCGAAAPLVCSNCGSAAYCGKEHQRAHWPEHKPRCSPCGVRQGGRLGDRLGRYLATRRAVEAGAVLVQEWPLVVGPPADAPADAPLCLGCHGPLAAASASARRPHQRPGCGACGAPVCDAECEKLAAHSRWECAELARRKAGAAFPLQAVLPLRCLIGVRSGSADWKAFLELESHLERRRAAAVWSERQRQIVEVLRDGGLTAADGSEDELVQRVCGVLDVNSFEVRGPAAAAGRPGPPLRAVFLRAAMMAHSCLPNCQLAVDDHLQLTVRASCAIPRDAPVYYNYCELLETTARRREHLLEGKYFECACPRCGDPTECGTHLSSLWCPRCLSGLVVPPSAGERDEPSPLAPPPAAAARALRPLPAAAAALPTSCSRALTRRSPSSQSSSWRCTACGHGVSARAARSALQRCSEAWEEARRGGPRCPDDDDDGDPLDARRLEALLARLSRTLPPRHALQLAVKQVLVALYRDAVLSARRPAAHALARMRDLCQEILDVLEALLPGHLSRLKGIALHELHLAVALGAGDPSAAPASTALPRARSLLQAALRHLRLEPRDSPEGRLHQLALQELAAVEESIRQDLYEPEPGPPGRAARQARPGRRRKNK